MSKGGKVPYSPEVADALCWRLIAPRTLTSICQDEDMPHRSCVYDWLTAHQEFADKFRLAKEMQVEAYVDEIFSIADDSQNDTMCDEHGNEKPNYENIHRSRLRVDVRKWYASKVYPRVYGEKPSEQLAQEEGNKKAGIEGLSLDKV